MKKLVYFAVFLMLAFNTSCLKKQNLEEENLGPAVAPESITKEMVDGFGSLDYRAIKPGEFSKYVLSQKIQDSSFDPIEQQDITFQSMQDTDQKLTLNLIAAKTDLSGGQSSQEAPRAWTINITKAEGMSAKAQSKVTEPELLFLQFQAVAFFGCYSSTKNSVSCHNLVTSEVQVKVPPSALSQFGQCNSTQDCFVTARKIEFDLLQLDVIDKDGKPKRTHFTFVLSKDVPYLSRVIQFCSRRLYDISATNQKVLADVCFKVTDYSFGNP